MSSRHTSNRVRDQGIEVVATQYFLRDEGFHPDAVRVWVESELGPGAKFEHAKKDGRRGYLITSRKKITEGLIDVLRDISDELFADKEQKWLPGGPENDRSQVSLNLPHRDRHHGGSDEFRNGGGLPQGGPPGRPAPGATPPDNPIAYQQTLPRHSEPSRPDLQLRAAVNQYSSMGSEPRRGNVRSSDYGPPEKPSRNDKDKNSNPKTQQGRHANDGQGARDRQGNPPKGKIDPGHKPDRDGDHTFGRRAGR